MFKTYYLGFVLSVDLLACVQPLMNETELNKFILEEENGLSKTVEVNAKSVRVSYRPLDLIIKPEVKAAGLKEEEKIRELSENYEQYLYFVLAFSAAGQEITNQTAANKEAFENAIK